jgi:hypothetical protein
LHFQRQLLHLKSDRWRFSAGAAALGLTLEVGYNGSESRHLDNLLNPGQPIPGNAPIVTRMPYPEWGPAGIQFLKADGVGNYNALLGKVSQRFGNNFASEAKSDSTRDRIHGSSAQA